MRVGEWLESIDEIPGVSSISPALIADLRDYLDSIAAGAASSLSDDLLPMRLPKGRLASLDHCERLALAQAAPDAGSGPTTEAVLRGVALDQFVAHQLVAGRVLDPVGSLAAMLDADGDWELLEFLAGLDPSDASESIDPLATIVSEAWAGVDKSFSARSQSPVMAVFGGPDLPGSTSVGSSEVSATPMVVCSGRIDVEIGGVLTGRPGVLVEIKSGRSESVQARSDHVSELYFYALLVALRDRSAPIALMCWYPSGQPATVPVSERVLETAAVRLGDSIVRWAELISGDSVPGESPGPWCSWCPDSGVCPSAFASVVEPDGRWL